MAINDYRALYLYGEPDLILSGGGWLGSSLNNLLEPRLERIARSVNLSPTNTRFNAILKRPTDIAAVYLGSTNLTPDADIEINFWPDSSFSGTPIATLNPTIPDDPDPDRRPSVFSVLDDVMTTQFVSVNIDDQLNPIGYIDLGYLHLGPYLKAPINYQYGAGMSFISNAVVAQTMSGGEAVWDKAEPRSLPLAFDYTDESAIFGDIYAMQRAIKRGGNVIVIPDPSADPVTIQRRSFMGHAVQRSAMAQTYFRLGAWGLEIREVMGLKPEIIAAVYRVELGGGSFLFTFPPTNLNNSQAAGLLPGLFLLTGHDLGFHRALRMALGTGVFALTGQSVSLRQTRSMQLGTGLFVVTGEPLDLTRQLKLALGTGSFTVTGGDAGLIVRRLQMGMGSFALTGQPLAFRRALRLGLGTGMFALTGGDVELSSGIRVQMGTGIFVLTGQPVGLLATRTMVLDGGSFSLTGGPLSMPVSLQLDTGIFSVTGAGTSLKASKRVQLGGGNFTVTGGDLGLTYQAKMSLGTGMFTLTGGDVDLRNYGLRVDTAGNTRVLAGDEAGNRRRTTN